MLTDDTLSFMTSYFIDLRAHLLCPDHDMMFVIFIPTPPGSEEEEIRTPRFKIISVKFPQFWVEDNGWNPVRPYRSNDV